MAYTIVTNAVDPIGTTTATCGGSTISGTGAISQKGVCYIASSTPVSPTITDSTLLPASGTTTSDFTSDLTGLTPGLTYYIRAYVTSNNITYYGATVVFTTLGLTTTAASAITSTTAISGATNISGFSLGSIAQSGVCWGINSNPTVGVSNFTTNNIIGNTFTSNISGLTPGTTYYVRSYIIRSYSINGVNTYYGTEISFVTLNVKPTVTTSPTITSFTSSGATISGTVVSDGGSAVTARGVQWSLNSNMSAGISVSSGSTGTGNYSVSLTGLNPATTYFVRAYATNINGTSYGAIYNFNTLGGPTVKTIAPYSITSNTAQTGCNVLGDGGSPPVTARGVVISTTPFPTLATGSAFTDSYPGNGKQYLVKLTGLTKDTTYYIRAYATNAQGTSYGEELIFSTTPCNPYIEDCNPQEEPAVQCADISCEYIIPATCVFGEFTSSLLCNNIASEDDLINQLKMINDKLCQLSSKDFAIFILGSIINNLALSTVFCNIKNNCLGG